MCRLHLGLVGGTLARLNTSVTATRIMPFAEPGLCVISLGDAAAGTAADDRAGAGSCPAVP
jgi:hypothetical protein